MHVLEVAGLHKRYGSVEALRGVGFAVSPGEIFGYLGPNGAGKTTTLRIATGLARADRGTVRLLGLDARLPRARERVGYLPGDLRFDAAMTAAAVLDHFARFRPARPPVLRAQLLETLRFDPADLPRKVKFLSHGTRQKLGLVAALQHDPELLLLDEPTSGLDPLVQRAFGGLLGRLAARGRAIVLSSHVLSEVEAWCARVAVIGAGRLLVERPVEALRALAVRRMTVRFRGAAPPGLTRLPGVVRASVNGAEAELWVQGDVNAVLRAVAAREVERFAFPEPRLEEAFFEYFEPEAGSDG